jgi:hypothetical protein
MKRLGFIALGALLGVVFVFLMPFLSAWLSPPTESGAPFSYDESNRQLKVFVMLGGGLFALIGGWIGNAAVISTRAALAMAGAVVLTTVALKVASMWLPVEANSAGALAVVLSAWALICALLSYLANRWVRRIEGQSA